MIRNIERFDDIVNLTRRFFTDSSSLRVIDQIGGAVAIITDKNPFPTTRI